MSLTLSDDLDEVLTAFYEHIKEHSKLKMKFKENERCLTLLKVEVVEARKAEKRATSNLKRVQENILKLQDITLNLSTVKVENERLRKEITDLENSLKKEKMNFVEAQMKWISDKESILERNKEELENMKKIRNMEAISLNREISRVQEDNNQKIEELKRGFQKLENEYKENQSHTVREYEDKIMNMNRDLIAAHNEVKNLRELTNNGLMTYNIEVNQPKSSRNIPQPISSFVRYRPVPIVSTASQLDHKESTELETISNITPEPQEPKKKCEAKKTNPNIKKRKLYSRADDSFCMNR